MHPFRRCLWFGCVAALTVVGCGPSAPPAPPVAPTPPAPTTEIATPAAPVAPPVVTVPPVVLPATDFLPGPLYFCVSGTVRTAIDYDARVDQLCRRHPEMGPCQYARDACRAKGGRVFTARDEEVTPAVEAEYDKHVRRVRFQADSAPAPR